MTYPIKEEKIDTTINNRNSNPNGSNMYELWLIKWPYSKTCDIEFYYPWQHICDSDDMENIPSVTSLVTRN
jgi:hypothetical protein